MKTWKEWSLKQEGTNPTEFDSAGEDQDLSNAGIPFDGPDINQVIRSEKERDEIERKYQLKLFKLMQKRTGENESQEDKDPSKGPVGHTTGGTRDSEFKDILKDKAEAMKKWKEKDDQIRVGIPVKTTSTAFLKDRKNLFTPRDDENPPRVDTHGPAADNK